MTEEIITTRGGIELIVTRDKNKIVFTPRVPVIIPYEDIIASVWKAASGQEK